MNRMTASAARTGASVNSTSFLPMAKGAPTVVDPLDDDSPDDDVVVTTRRAISRVALVAAETAGRFQREAVAVDPMTWMMAPRTLFDDLSALDACLGRDACLRGVLLHGLSLGLDADPAAIDALVANEEDEDEDEDGDVTVIETGGGGDNVLPFPAACADGPRLFTATVVSGDGFETIQVFHASLAIDEAEIVGRLRCRIGAASADARIVSGFDPTDPLVAALVSSAICEALALVASDPGSPLAAGLDLNVEQRFLG